MINCNFFHPQVADGNVQNDLSNFCKSFVKTLYRSQPLGRRWAVRRMELSQNHYVSAFWVLVVLNISSKLYVILFPMVNLISTSWNLFDLLKNFQCWVLLFSASYRKLIWVFASCCVCVRSCDGVFLSVYATSLS
jgi:hypothetical protein